MKWFSSFPPRSITSFSNLAAAFESQFATNKTKHLESWSELMTHVKKIFVKAFQKGLWVGPFSDSLTLSQPTNMTEIKAHVEKHVEAKEDKEDCLLAEKSMSSDGKKIA
ncbi:hypothetical protein CR513_62381, partial [Mucuna pruriens]